MPRPLFVFMFALAVVCTLGGSAHAKIVTKAVPYKDGDVELEGYLAYDDAADGVRPGVLVIHEWWGLNDYTKKRAQMLAEMGYVGFAADMYGKGVLAKDPKEAGALASGVRMDKAAWMKRAKAGLDQLRAVKQTDGKRVAAIGYCFGGSTVLNMALTGIDVNVVASFHGALPTDVTVDQAKATKTKILVAHGALDSFIKDEVIAKFRAVLDEAKTDYEFVYYANAVHSFTNPDADMYKVPGVSYNAAADRRSWAHMKQLFDEAFEAGGKATAKGSVEDEIVAEATALRDELTRAVESAAGDVGKQEAAALKLIPRMQLVVKRVESLPRESQERIALRMKALEKK